VIFHAPHNRRTTAVAHFRRRLTVTLAACQRFTNNVCLLVSPKRLFDQLSVWQFKLLLLALAAPCASGSLTSVVILLVTQVLVSWNLPGGFIAHSGSVKPQGTAGG
jgi:hypothetical protein